MQQLRLLQNLVDETEDVVVTGGGIQRQCQSNLTEDRSSDVHIVVACCVRHEVEGLTETQGVCFVSSLVSRSSVTARDDGGSGNGTHDQLSRHEDDDGCLLGRRGLRVHGRYTVLNGDERQALAMVDGT